MMTLADGVGLQDHWTSALNDHIEITACVVTH